MHTRQFIPKHVQEIKYVPKLRTDFIQAMFYDSTEQRIGQESLKRNLFVFLSSKTTPANEVEKAIRNGFPGRILGVLDKTKLQEIRAQMKKLTVRDIDKLDLLANRQVEIIAEAVGKIEMEIRERIKSRQEPEPFDLKLLKLLIE